MHRQKLGRRVFRFEEEWTNGTASYRDKAAGTMRSEAKIHVVRCSKTVAELRDLDLAQQNPNAKRSGDLFSIAMEAVKDYFKPLPGQKQYVSVLLLDSHWDKAHNMITGHAALGGGSGEIQLAVFGSQALQSYPSHIEEVVPAFSDCTPTDTNFVANDCNEVCRLLLLFRLVLTYHASLEAAGRRQILVLALICTKLGISLVVLTKLLALCCVIMSH